MFEAEIEGHVLTVDASSLAEWQAVAFLGPTSLAVVAASVVLMVFAPRTRLPIWTLCAGLAVVVTAIAFVFYSDEPDGPLFRLLPSLDARTSSVGVTAALGGGAALGAALGLVVGHLAAWRRPGVIAILAALGIVTSAVLAGIGLSAAQPVRALRAELASYRSVPHLQAEPVSLHVGRSRAVEVSATELGFRQRGFLGLGSRVRSPEPDALEGTGWSRERVRDGALSAWTAHWQTPGVIVVNAPTEPGPFETTVELRRPHVSIRYTFESVAIDDAGDPLFAIHSGSRRVWARTAERTSVTALPDLVVEVTDESVVDGFVTFELTATSEGAETETYRVIPWEGALRFRPEPDASQFLERLEARGPETPGYVRCQIPPIPAFCLCDERGPVECIKSDDVEGGLRLGLGLLTLGITEATTFGGRPVRQWRWKLIEMDGEALEDPTEGGRER